MPLYARYGVSFMCLIDPIKKTLEAYELKKDWQLIGSFKNEDRVNVAPINEVTLLLSDLWCE